MLSRGLLATALLAASANIVEGKCCCCATWFNKNSGQPGSMVIPGFPQNADDSCKGQDKNCWDMAGAKATELAGKPKPSDSWMGHLIPITEKSCASVKAGAQGLCDAFRQDHVKNDLGTSREPVPNKEPLATVVMDFDCTLSENHLYKTTHKGFEGTPGKPSETQKRLLAAPEGATFAALPLDERWRNAAFARWIMGGDERIEMLKSKLAKLRSEGVKVEIATWSEPERVNSVLDLTGLNGEIDRIHGRSNCRKVNQKAVCDYHAFSRVSSTEVAWITQTIPTHLTKKQDWVKHLSNSGLAGTVLFADDTADNYNGLAGSGVITLDNAKFGLSKDGHGLTASAFEDIEKQLLGSSGVGEEPLYENYQQSPVYENTPFLQQQLRGQTQVQEDAPPPVPKRNHKVSGRQ